jgi:3-oxoacyl-[acyl-carrier-protein] synthase II
MLQQPRRVVVTGIGLVTPLGNDMQRTWSGILEGRSGVGVATRFDASKLPVRIAAEVRAFNPESYVDKKDVKKMDVFALYAVAAAQMAMRDAGMVVEEDSAHRFGVIIGSGIGGIATLEETLLRFHEGGIKKVSPFFVPRVIGNMAPGQVAIRLGATGVNYATTSACASGGHAIGEAFRLIRDGSQDAMIAGGAEAPVTSLCVAGFAAMRALSTRNEAPASASRPFERSRDGFVIGEGAGILVLEERQRAIERGAHLYAELIGYGANSDAYHITKPSPAGNGAARCMRLALGDADVDPSAVDYLNAHGTATEQNDINETEAIKSAFGEAAARLAVSSTKSMIGHSLGAAGAIEAAVTALAVRDQVAPPTINYDEPDPRCDLDYVPNRARRMQIEVAISNSFGFGGANSCLVFRRAAG